jgi:protein SCO1/2
MYKLMNRSRWLLFFGAAMISLGLAWWAWTQLRPHQFGGTLLQSPSPAYNFSLTGPQGSKVQLSDLRGKAVLVYFGYTTCPDVCPTTLKTVGKVLDQLGKQAEQVQAVMITVDPEKDSPARLAAYLNNVEKRVMGLSGDLETITQIATQYGVFFQKRPFGSEGGYLVDHTATLMLVDAKGYLRVIYPYDAQGALAGAMADDIRYILTH